MYHILLELARTEGKTLGCTKKDLANEFKPLHDNIAHDAKGLHKFLYERRETTGLQFSWTVDENGSLLCVILEVPGASAAWDAAASVLGNLGVGPMVIYDTAFGTNKYGLKLVVLSVSDEESKTKICVLSFVVS
jgi:hypothetical protein